MTAALKIDAGQWKHTPPPDRNRCEAITLRGFRCINRSILVNASGRRYCGQHSARHTAFIPRGCRDFPPVSPEALPRIWLRVSFLMRRARGQIEGASP